MKKVCPYLLIVRARRRNIFSATDRVLSSFVFKIHVVWPEKQSEQVGDYIFWSRSTLSWHASCHDAKKEMHSFTSCSEKISARWHRTHSNINIFMKAFVCSALECCFKSLELLCVESMLVTLWSTKYVCIILPRENQ